MNLKKLKKILYKKQRINFKYLGERNFDLNTSIFFEEDINIEIKRNKEMFEKHVKKFEIFKIKKNDKIKYLVKDETYIYSKRTPIKFLKIKFYIWYKQIIIISSLLVSFPLTVMGFEKKISDVFWLNVIILILGIGTLFLQGYKLIKYFIDNHHLKKYFNNKNLFLIEPREKNDKEIKNINYIEGKFKVGFFFIQIKFPQSSSKIIHIRYYKHNKTFEYEYIQSFKKETKEPDQFMKKGKAKFYCEKLNGEYWTIDKTKTKGNFLISKK